LRAQQRCRKSLLVLSHPLPHGPNRPPTQPTAFIATALRVIEVRDAYARDGFEWDQLQRLVIRDTKTANLKLMRRVAEASLRAAAAPAAAAVDGEGGGGGGGEMGG